jgi:hypothetical protein
VIRQCRKADGGPMGDREAEEFNIYAFQNLGTQTRTHRAQLHVVGCHTKPSKRTGNGEHSIWGSIWRYCGDWIVPS